MVRKQRKGKLFRFHNPTTLNSNRVERYTLVAVHMRQIGNLLQALDNMTHNHVSSIYDKSKTTRLPKWGMGFRVMAKRELFLCTPALSMVTTPGMS